MIRQLLPGRYYPSKFLAHLNYYRIIVPLEEKKDKLYNPQTTLLFNVDFCTSKNKYYISYRKRYINIRQLNIETKIKNKLPV